MMYQILKQSLDLIVWRHVHNHFIGSQVLLEIGGQFWGVHSEMGLRSGDEHITEEHGIKVNVRAAHV